MIDWPNLLVGGLLAVLIGYPFYWKAKQGADRQYQHLVGLLEKLQQEGAIKIEKDQRGIVVKVDLASISIQGMPPVLRMTAEKADPPA